MAALTLEQALQAAITQHQAGNLAAAEAIYRQILAVQPGHADALHLLGAAALQSGRNEEAIELIGRAIRLAPQNPVYHSNLGEACRRHGKLEEAIAHLRQAVSLRPDYPDAWNNLGSALAQRQLLDEAVTCFQRSLASRPDHIPTLDNLALALMKQRRTTEAIECYRNVVVLAPASPEALNHLGHALLQEERWDEAIECCRRALVLRPEFAKACGNLGLAFLGKDQPDEAIAWSERALSSDPNSGEALNNLAVAFLQKGQFGAALNYCERALAAEPQFAPAHWAHALMLLRLGRYEEGWQEYEWRWQSPPVASFRRGFQIPQWDGRPTPGQTILAHAEQGYGDSIQFLRYVLLLRNSPGVGRVIVECSGPLTQVVSAALGEGTEVFPRETWDGSNLPPFDWHIPWHSLPLVLRRFAPEVPATPYLRATPNLQAPWRERLGPHTTFRIGLAWAGNPGHQWDRHRSIAPERLLPLLRLPGATFYSLQVEPRNATPQSLLDAGLIDHTTLLHDFADTAAFMTELDLIISVDSAIAHLAGALGCPVWTLLPFVPDWRWGLVREDTPWYPSMRLFRQPAIGDWDPVLRRAEEACAQLTSVFQTDARK